MADTSISNIDENKGNLITKTSSYITNIRRLLNEPAAKRALPTVLALLIAFVGILIFITMREPAKTTLFSSLTEGDKAKVVESLRQKGIDVSLALVLSVVIRIFTLWFTIFIGFIGLKLIGVSTTQEKS